MTLTGWGVTAWFVEPRYSKKAPDEGGPTPVSDEDLEARKITTEEKRGLLYGGVALFVFLIGLLMLIVASNRFVDYLADAAAGNLPSDLIVEMLVMKT